MMDDLRSNQNWAFQGIFDGIATYDESGNIRKVEDVNTPGHFYLEAKKPGTEQWEVLMADGPVGKIFFLSIRVAVTYDPNGKGTPSGGWTGYFSHHEDWFGVMAKIISSGDYLLENDEQKRAVADEFAKWVIANGWG